MAAKEPRSEKEQESNGLTEIPLETQLVNLSFTLAGCLSGYKTLRPCMDAILSQIRGQADKKNNDFLSPKMYSFIVVSANDAKYSFQFDKIFRFRFLCEDFLMVSNSKKAKLKWKLLQWAVFGNRYAISIKRPETQVLPPANRKKRKQCNEQTVISRKSFKAWETSHSYRWLKKRHKVNFHLCRYWDNDTCKVKKGDEGPQPESCRHH